MLKRKAEEKLNDWLIRKNALLISGARQVGKSFLVREWGKKHFRRFVEINLFENSEWIEVIENAKGVDDLLFRVSMMSEKELIKGDTLIFFDEIQCAKKADLITLSKFLVQDGKYRYIFSGSLLGVSLNNTLSWPVGYMEEITMYPLDFEEFLWAVGVNETVFSHLRDCFDCKKPVDDFIHSKIIDIYYKYLLIGGMPEAVEAFIKTNDLKKVNKVQSNINSFYIKDITQYAEFKQKVHLERIYDLLPKELNSKNKRFYLGAIGKDKQIAGIEDDFMWLTKAGIAIPAFNVDTPASPLLLARNSRLVKLFASDVGLLSYRLMDTEVQLKLLNKSKDINYGAIFENAVAQELAAHRFSSFYYFNSKKQGEVDFLLEYGGEVLPIEVKSGKAYKRHSALENLLANNDYQIKQAIVFSCANLETKGKILYLPIYMTMFLRKKEEIDAKIKIDLSDLDAKFKGP
jgi:uncharacterized protein